MAMRLRRPIRRLVFCLPVLLTSAAVLGGATVLAGAFDDASVSRVLAVIDVIILILLAVNVILLVGTLGFQSVLRQERKREMGRRWRRDGRQKKPGGPYKRKKDA